MLTVLEETVTLAQFVTMLKKHLPIVIATFVIALAITCGFAYNKAPLYTATAQYYANLRQDYISSTLQSNQSGEYGQNNQGNQSGAQSLNNPQSNLQNSQHANSGYTDINDPQTLSTLKSQQEFIESQTGMVPQLTKTSAVLQPIIEEYQLKITPESLAKRIAVGTGDNNLFITVQVSDENPELAANIANAIGKQLNIQLSSKDINGQPISQISLTTIQPAVAPSQPSSSGRSTLLIGFLASVIVSIIIGVACEVLDRRVHETGDITRLIDIPILATILQSSALTGKPVVIADPSTHVAEQMRRLALNLQFISPDKKQFSNVLVVSSAGAADGKTTIATNLAVAYAERGETVLLIDTDLRKPSVARTLGINGKVGLTHLLTEQVEAPDAFQTYWKDNLHVLPAGNQTTNPSMIINSHAMTDLLTQVAAEYDHVIIDTTPLSVANDATVFANMGCLLLLVVSRGKTLKGQLRRVIAELETVNTLPVGAVLNRAKASRSEDGYYYHKYYGRERQK